MSGGKTIRAVQQADETFRILVDNQLVKTGLSGLDGFEAQMVLDGWGLALGVVPPKLEMRGCAPGAVRPIASKPTTPSPPKPTR